MKYKVGDIVIPVAAASQDENKYPGFPEIMRRLVQDEVKMTVVDIKGSKIHYVCRTDIYAYWWLYGIYTDLYDHLREIKLKNVYLKEYFK